MKTASDDRRTFQCGQADLDRFFQQYAGQNQFKLGVAVTYVAVVDDVIAGFATVSVGHLEQSSLPPAAVRRRLPAYSLPVLRLARLAVDRRAQGCGIGKALLQRICALAVAQRAVTGCVGVVTDAKPQAIEFYCSLGFVLLEGVREGRLHGDAVPMFLALDTIRSAMRG